MDLKMRMAAPLLALGIAAGCAPSGELVEFVKVGPLPVSGVDPVELGWGGAGSDMAAALEGAAEEASSGPGSDDRDDAVAEAVEALEYQPPGGTRAFAFVLPGCADTGAELVVEDEAVSADLTGGEDVNCGQANYFVAVFAIDADAVPAGARPQ